MNALESEGRVEWAKVAQRLALRNGELARSATPTS
jgi:hypothetical protein